MVCAMIGGGSWNDQTPYERQIRRYAEKRCPGHVRFLGTRRDALELYPDMDVAVHPSHSENLGGAPESLLCGVPTVATDVGGLPDVIEPGVTGWLVAPKKPAELADTIDKVLSDPVLAKRTARAGQAKARDIVDVKVTSREVIGIYERILSPTCEGHA